jgi:hypothetical protein
MNNAVADRLLRREGDEPVRKSGEEKGPVRPDVNRPGGGPSELIKRLRKVNPEQAKRYRQRSGQ